MQDDIQYLRERVDGIADTLARNTVILENNTESLKEHIRRTDLLEEQMRWFVWAAKFSGIIGALVMFGWTLAYYYNQMIRP